MVSAIDSSKCHAHTFISGPYSRPLKVAFNLTLWTGIVLDSACDSSVPLDACIQSFVQSIAGTVAIEPQLS